MNFIVHSIPSRAVIPADALVTTKRIRTRTAKTGRLAAGHIPAPQIHAKVKTTFAGRRSAYGALTLCATSPGIDMEAASRSNVPPDDSGTAEDSPVVPNGENLLPVVRVGV